MSDEVISAAARYRRGLLRGRFRRLFSGRSVGMTAGLPIVACFLGPALVGLFVFRLIPIAIALIGSLYSENLMGERIYEGLGNFRSIFSDPRFWESFRVTLIFNLFINPMKIISAFVAAMLTFGRFRGAVTFRVLFFLPMTLSIGLTAILWDLLLNLHVGPVNAVLEAMGYARQGFFTDEDQALWTIMAVSTWKALGYYMIFLLAGLYNISDEYYEAARMDGAGSLQTFFRITLPLMRRPLAFVLVAATAINFVFFAPVFIVTEGGPNGSTNVLMYMTYKSAFTFGDWGRAMASATVILFMIGVIAIVELRLLRARSGEM